MSFLGVALNLARRGWAVFPCKPASKAPATLTGFKEASADEVAIRQWWTALPDANIGIACGASGISVLDADHGITDEASFHAWRERNNLPITYTVRTGRRPEFGIQAYYAGTMPGCNFTIDGVSGQIRGVGQYVMAAESIHPESGERYKVLVDVPLAPLPDFLREIRKPTAAPSNNAKVPRTRWTLPVHESENRTAFLLEQTGQLRNLGCGFDAIFAHMASLNDDPEIIADPVDGERLRQTAENCCKFAVPTPPPTPVLGGKKPGVPHDPDEAPVLSERTPRPIYPDAVWDGTIFGDFSDIVSRGNFIPKKFATEAFRGIVGAIAGDQVTCGLAGVRLREFIAGIGEPQSGKSFCLECAENFFTVPSTRHLFEPMLILHGGDNSWRGAGIGVQKFLPGSPNSFVDELTRDSKSKPEKPPAIPVTITTQWKPVARLITIQGEAMSLFARLASPDWTGQALSALVTDLYDSMDAEVAITGQRAAPKIPVRLQYSMLLFTQPRIWRKFMADHLMDSGLFGRFYIVGSAQKPKRVALPDYANDPELFNADFGQLRRDVFSRLQYLVDHPLRMTIEPEVKRRIEAWESSLPDVENVDLQSRMGVHVWRAAMARAWGSTKQRDRITVEDADAAILLGDYQRRMREHYAPSAGDSVRDKHVSRVENAIKQAGQIPMRELRRLVNADRFREDFERAIDWLSKRGRIAVTETGRHKQTVAWLVGRE